MNLLISSLFAMGKYHGQVTHIISVVDPDDAHGIPSLGVPLNRRVVLVCDDVDSKAEALSRERSMPGSGCIAATRAMAKKALAFSKALSAQSTLLVYCGHGISRSSALAYAILCQSQLKVPVADVFRQVLQLRPQAVPNPLIVALADSLLGWNGRMLRATAQNPCAD